MKDNIKKELISLAKIAPISGYIESGDFRITGLKEKYNVSIYYLVEVLEYLEKKEDIRELKVTYDIDDKHILSFKFR